MDYGFFHDGTGKVAGEHVAAFSEFLGKGLLRSYLGSPSLQRMVALYPKDVIRAGYDKTALMETTCKLFALDALTSS